ncbi:MAG: type II toxin-antitoxin system prevent-host-death family antitoxin [Solirubrobacteraceae bacterium]
MPGQGDVCAEPVGDGERGGEAEAEAEVIDGGDVRSIGIRALARNVSGVVADVAETGRPALLTKHGAPIAALVPIQAARAEDQLLARAARRLEEIAAADLLDGRTRGAAEVVAELRRLADAVARATSLDEA